MVDLSEISSNVDLSDPALYINREISLLEFHKRCLEEALDTSLPLLERVRFLAIFSNNLDEFFMTRVSALKDQVTAGIIETPADGMAPQAQLDEIRQRVLYMLTAQRQCFHEDLLPKLAEQGVYVLSYTQLQDAQKDALRRYFENEVFPILTPLAVDPGRPFPHISNLSVNLAISVRDQDGPERFARVKVPSTLSRLISVNDALRKYAPGTPLDGHRFIWLEELIQTNLDLLFPGASITATGVFRIIRNSDMEIAEEEASDLLEMIEESVKQRYFGQVVQMTVSENMPAILCNMLTEHLGLTQDDVYFTVPPLGMSELFALANIDMPMLKYPPYQPARPSIFSTGEDIFTVMKRGDILVHRPYESFIPTIEFFQQAAEDPNVLAIKATLYRTGSKSPIVEALLRAQENSKQVAVLVELKARFDEENNIGWARALESRGVHVVYGLVGLKTHAKVALVVRKEGDGIKRYVHLSTGNYNATTARIYTDFCMFTAREDIAADATLLFNRLTGYAVRTEYHTLAVAPEYLRGRIVSLIEREIAHAKAGHPAHLIFKMNALVDAPMIRLLYQASMAGVKIDLLVRGMCCLRPGVPGISENIRVTCVLARYLEHSRIYYFLNGGEEEVYMASADLMPRNLDHRVETMFPVTAPTLKERIINEVLHIEMQDNVKARELLHDGTYQCVLRRPDDSVVDSQRWFMEHSRDR
jgi:polyphosphate kinase